MCGREIFCGIKKPKTNKEKEFNCTAAFLSPRHVCANVCLCVWGFVCVRVCIYVCGCERERQRERGETGEREREKEKEREREREREGERERERKREREGVYIFLSSRHQDACLCGCKRDVLPL